jgi:hypothetical protein
MQDSIAEHRPIRAAALIALGIGGLFAARRCRRAPQWGAQATLSRFSQIPAYMSSTAATRSPEYDSIGRRREQELKQLMDKAEKGTGGTFINVIAYQNDYVSAKEQIKVLTATARAKNCATPENWRSNSSFR